jgi:hypothetical protein
MKPLAARACARPLTAPSTMTLLEQLITPGAPSTARSTALYGAGMVAFVGGLPSRTLPLDSLVGSLAARPIASLSPVRHDQDLKTTSCRLCLISRQRD